MEKIRLVHILTELEHQREKASINSLSPVSKVGIEYLQQVNQRYTGEDWKLVKALSQTEHTQHGPGHYGAFQSFKKAILENFTSDLDALILCECDCVLEVTPEVFLNNVKRGLEFCQIHNLNHFSLGGRFVQGYLQSPISDTDPNFEDFYITNKIILAHCIVLTPVGREFYLDVLQGDSWDSPDLWFSEINWRHGNNRFGISYERSAYQHEGFSLIDNCWKDSQ
ncbi:hypothetical protein EBS02_02585 [bacterium]|nr:hypothetical protein [bacterium]